MVNVNATCEAYRQRVHQHPGWRIRSSPSTGPKYCVIRNYCCALRTL